MKSPSPKTTISCLVILAVVLAWFSPWWAAGRVMAPLDLQNLMMSPWRAGNDTEFAKNHIVADGVDQYLVYRLIAERDYQREGWVGWSSLTYGGTAQYANTMALYFDWTMQLHRWFGFWTAWHLGLMGQVMLAAYGMYLFLRGRNTGHLWAVCGGLAYAANSQFVTWFCHRWALGAFCWVPWILWAIDAYRRGKRGFWAAVPLLAAMAFLGGTLQHGALVVLAVMAMWMDEALQQRSKSKTLAAPCDRRTPGDRKSSDGHQPPLQQQARILGRYAAWGLLACGLAAMMFLPCIDAFLTSNRLGLHMGMNVNAEHSIYPRGTLQPLFNLAAYPLQIMPSILGRCDSVDVLKLFKSELFYVCYFGSIPVLIAYLCLFRRGSPVLARVLILIGLLLPLTPLVRVLYQRLFLLFIIGGILAFCHFMEHASRETRLGILRASAWVAGVAMAAWTAASALLLSKPELTARMRDVIATEGRGSSFGYFTQWLELRADRFISDLFIWSPNQMTALFFLTAGWIGMRLTASLTGNRRRIGAVLVAGVVTMEVTDFAAKWVTWTDPARQPLFAEVPESRALEQHVGSGGRVTTLTHPTGHMANTPFIPNNLCPYGIATISGYDSIIPDGMILPKESPGDAAKLGRLAVTHLITWTGNPDVSADWNEMWKSPMMTLYENPQAVPRYIGFRDELDKNTFFSGKQGEPVRLWEKTGLENRRNIRVPAGVRWIRVAENEASGWQYRPAGDPSAPWRKVERAPDASMLMANPKPEGEAHIEMRYNPPLRNLGFAISGLSLLLLGAGQWRARRGRTVSQDGNPHSLPGIQA